MDFGRLLQMIFGRLLRRGMMRGVDHLARGGKAPQDMTPEERARHQQSRQMQKRLRDAQRITRRLGR